MSNNYKNFPWPTLLNIVNKRFPWPTFLKTVNKHELSPLIRNFEICDYKKTYCLIYWVRLHILIVLLWTFSLFVTKHHHWLFGQNRTSLNSLLLTRIKIGEDKLNQCSKTLTWFFKMSFSIPQSSVRTYACCVPDCIHTFSEKCYKYRKVIIFQWYCNIRHWSPYCPLFEVVR